jgi:nitroimidazol reductase NimA-like FMN-containing flavoprotein (pyridoxamine 5'-phosphate oxidase superfamily)
MTSEDEPIFPGDGPDRAGSGRTDPGLADRIRRLVTEQPYGVLCTQGDGQPYGSLVALAFSDDLSYVVFATPVATRKYRLLSGCDHVALLVDSRSQHPDDMMTVEAVTITGRATEIERGEDRESCSRLLIDRHPQLESFVHAASSAVFRIDVFRYFHVGRFQEVGQWIPPSR